MQLISLRIKGFGSFAKEQPIDFSRMSGLWLVTGKTGAGKTTLFDAITFALYGTTSGTARVSGRTSMGLRSDFLKDNEESFVELVFMQDGKRWTVKRTPAWKKEGNKTATAETVSLSSDDESYEKTPADNRIRELLRMDLDQFRQLIMIAQNDFEKLVLEAGQREVILRKLLNTGRFERFQQLIRDERNAADTNQKAILAALQKQARQFVWDESAAEEECVRIFQLHRDQPDVQVTEQLTESMQAQQSRARLAVEAESAKLEPLSRRKSDLEQQHGAAEQLHKRFLDLQALRGQVDRDEADVPAKKAEKTDLDRRSDALSAAPLLKARDAARTDAEEKLRRLTEAAAALKQAEEGSLRAAEAAKAVPELERKQKDAEALAGSLREKLPLFEQLNAKAAELEEKRKNSEQAGQELASHKAGAEKLKQQLSSLKVSASGEAVYAAQAGTLQAEKDKLSRLVTDLKALQKDEKRYLEDEAALRDLHDSAVKAWNEYSEIHSRFLSNEYAVVVKELKPGCPCPVCGSTEHPKPYDPSGLSGITVTAAEDSKAHDLHEAAADRYNQAKAALEALSGTVRSSREKLGLTGPVSEALENACQEEKRKADALAAVNAALEQAKADAGKVRDIEAELAVLEKNESVLQEALSQASGEFQRVQGEYAALQGSMPAESEDTVRTGIADADRNASACREEISRLSGSLTKAEADLAAAKEKKAGADTGKKEADDKLSVAEQDLLQAMAEHHFASEADLAALLTLSPKEITSRRDLLTKWETERENHKRMLSDLEIELKDQKDPDPAAIREEIDKVQHTVDELNQTIEGYKTAFDRNQTVSDQTGALLGEWRDARDKALLLNSLYATAIGPKGQNKTFEVYIQRYYFKHVIDLANRRFRSMTDGMFELRLNQSNLELNVMDYRTGRERPVGTLSGGEKFKAALSMALGMSDMVQSEIRDVQLGTLFIDEGFGTLDAESIDMAIDILRQLSSDTGRLIAVISHREEMEAGIDQKLVVRKHNEGDREKGSYIEFNP